MIDTIVIGVACFSGGALFMAALRAAYPAEAITCMSDDALLIARLTDERDEALDCNDRLQADYIALRDENADLHTDIEAKRKRLEEHGLQSAGGVER